MIHFFGKINRVFGFAIIYNDLAILRFVLLHELGYLPIQKLEKISPSKSSLVNSPVIVDKIFCA